MENANQNPNTDPSSNVVRNWLSAIAIVLILAVGVTYALHRKNTMSPVVAGDMSSSTDATSSMQDADTDTAATDTATADAATSGSSATASSATAVVASGTFKALPGTSMTSAAGESVSASDQPAGSTVAISSMKLTRESWVAVEAMNGTILGAGIFPASATSGSIPLMRDTASGTSYEVVIYADDGDKVFDFHKDLLIVGTDGTPVSSAFTAQ